MLSKRMETRVIALLLIVLSDWGFGTKARFLPHHRRFSLPPNRLIRNRSGGAFSLLFQNSIADAFSESAQNRN